MSLSYIGVYLINMLLPIPIYQ